MWVNPKISLPLSRRRDFVGKLRYVARARARECVRVRRYFEIPHQPTLEVETIYPVHRPFLYRPRPYNDKQQVYLL